MISKIAYSIIFFFPLTAAGQTHSMKILVEKFVIEGKLNGSNKLTVTYSLVNNSPSTILVGEDWNKTGLFLRDGIQVRYPLKEYIYPAHKFIPPESLTDSLKAYRLSKVVEIRKLLRLCNKSSIVFKKSKYRYDLDSYFIFKVHVVPPNSRIELTGEYYANKEGDELIGIELTGGFDFSFYDIEANKEIVIKNCIGNGSR